MRSITHAEDAQKVFVATGREEETIHCQLSMAETHRLLGKVNLSQYNAIYERYEKVDSRWGKIHTLIGQALALQHQQQPAGDVLRRAKEMAQWSNLETEIQFISRIENSQPNEEVHLLNFP
jgi:hypothetical protein